MKNNRLNQHFWIFWLIPGSTIVLAATNELHFLIWTDFIWSPAGNNMR